jgi:hypothetical protein
MDWLHILLLAIGLALLLYALFQMQSPGAAESYTGNIFPNAIQQANLATHKIEDVVRQRNIRERIPPGNLDPVFYPAPPVSDRVQSVQYEHEQSQEPYFSIDYQALYKFSLMSPAGSTVVAYRDATRAQIQHVQDRMHQQFDQLAVNTSITQMSFNAPFKAANEKNERFIKNWKPSQTTLDVLQSYQRQISDDVYSEFSRMMYSYGLDITPTGGVTKLARSDSSRNQVQEAQFPTSSALYTDPLNCDGLVTKARAGAKPYSEYSHAELERLAHRYVVKIFQMLVDKYKFVIRDLSSSVFHGRSDEIMDTGTDLLMHYFITETPSKAQLDDFTTEVEDSMRESLFQILIDNSIDVSQFD